jgi:hypothetical protein
MRGTGATAFLDAALLFRFVGFAFLALVCFFFIVVSFEHMRFVEYPDGSHPPCDNYG